MKNIGVVMLGVGAGLVAAVVAYGVLQSVQGSSKPPSEDKFVQETRAAAAGDPGSEVKSGSLPASNADPSMVPVIEVETTQFYIGTIPNDKLGEGHLKVTNRGKSDLQISKVSTSCGCTQGKMSKEVIPPGESAPLDITVDPARIAGFKSTKTLTIYSNDPKQPALAVQVSADVDPEFAIEPAIIDFGVVGKGEEVTKSAKIIQKTAQPFEISEAVLVGNDIFYSLNFAEVPKEQWASPDKREYVANVSVTPTAPTGPLRGSVLLKTSLKRLPSTVIPLTAEIKGVYQLEPKTVTLRSVKPGEKMENVLKLTSEVPITVTEIVAPNAQLKVESHPGTEPNTTLFDVTVGESPNQRWQRDTWTLKLKVGDTEYLEDVKVMAIIADGTNGGLQIQQPANPKVEAAPNGAVTAPPVVIQQTAPPATATPAPQP